MSEIERRRVYGGYEDAEGEGEGSTRQHADETDLGENGKAARHPL